MMLTRGKKNKTPCCIKCNVNLNKRAGAVKIVKTMAEAKKLTPVMSTTIVKGDSICKKCTEKYISESSNKENEEKSNLRERKQSKTPTYEEFSWGEESSPSDDSSDDPDFQLENDNDDPDLSSDSDSQVKPAKIAKMDVTLEPFQKIKADADSCFICQSKTDLIEVPITACQQVTIEARLFIPMEIKCCQIHLQNDSFSKEDIEKIIMQQRNWKGNKTEVCKSKVSSE